MPPRRQRWSASREPPPKAFAPHRITSNCICPGVVQTPLWERLDAEWSAIEGWATGEAWKRRTAGIQLGRPERHEDVAGIVDLLLVADTRINDWRTVCIR